MTEGQTGIGHVEVRVHGMVQGVGFRFFTLRVASRLGLAGWVANEPDGSVSVVAEGAAQALDELVRALESGPPGAAVGRVEVHRGPATGRYVDFGVRSSWHRGD